MNDIKLRDARKILKKNGYTLAYINGDHHVYRKEGGSKIILPFHLNRDNSCPYPIWAKVCKRNNIQF